MTIQPLLFDAYGTLFDVHGGTARPEQLFADLGDPLRALWRDTQIEYTRLVPMSSVGVEPTRTGRSLRDLFALPR